MTNITISIDDDTNEIKKKLKNYGFNISEICSMALIHEWNKINPAISDIDKIQKQLNDVELKFNQITAEKDSLEKELNSLRSRLSHEKSMIEKKEIREREEKEQEEIREKEEYILLISERRIELVDTINRLQKYYETDNDDAWLAQIEKKKKELSDLELNPEQYIEHIKSIDGKSKEYGI